MRAIGDSELSEPSVQTTLQPDAPDAARGDASRSACGVRNNGPTRTLAPQGTLAPRRADDRRRVPRADASRTGRPSRCATSRRRRRTRAVVARPSRTSTRCSAVGRPRESSYTARVGLRQLTWHGGRLYLNGAPAAAARRLASRRTRAGTATRSRPATRRRSCAELKAIGANAVRSQHPLDPALLERLDAAGILVWQGIGPVEGAGNWYSTTPTLLREAEQQARTAALAAQLHPSIIAWNLVNEVAGNGRDAAEVSYVQTLTRWLHEHDPARHGRRRRLGRPPARARRRALPRRRRRRRDRLHRLVRLAAGLRRAQQRARCARACARRSARSPARCCVISEFGAESNTLNPPRRARQLRLPVEPAGAPHRRLRRRPASSAACSSGACATTRWCPSFQGGSIHCKLPALQLIEGINQKGLFTYGGARQAGRRASSHGCSGRCPGMSGGDRAVGAASRTGASHRAGSPGAPRPVTHIRSLAPHEHVHAHVPARRRRGERGHFGSRRRGSAARPRTAARPAGRRAAGHRARARART